MAFYQDSTHLVPMTNPAFDAAYGPAQVVPHSGIYRCQGCGSEIAANVGDPLPPQNRHQHSALQGAIRWQLQVWTKY